MIQNRKKRILALATSAMLCLSTTSAIYAASTFKNLKAEFPGIKISYNGQVKTGEKEPFIVDSTTYVPIRMVGELVGKAVSWDGATKQILITDGGSSSTSTPAQSQQVSQLTAQLAQKDIELIRLKQEKAALEQQIETLKTEKDRKSNTDLDLDELEDQLIDDYGKYKSIKFDIELRGDEDDIDVRIKVDLDDYSRYWSRLSEKDIESFIKDICDDIWDVYDDADIEGYIYDTDDREYLIEFESDSRQRLSFDYAKGIDIADLESDINYDFKNYFKDFRVSILVDGDEDEVDYEVRVDYKDYEDEWDALSNSQIRNFLSAIYDDIEDEAPDADIRGYVYTSSNRELLAEYWRTSSGSDRFERYNP